MNDDNIIGWFSLDNGAHVPIKKGESKREATSKFLNKKMSRVQRNKEKYDKIDNFKKRKQSNITTKKDDDEEIEYLDLDDKPKDEQKGMRFIQKGSTYIPIRSKEDERQEDEKQENEKEYFYNEVAHQHTKNYEDRKRGLRQNADYYYGADKDVQDEINSKLDAIVEKGEIPTKEQVREVIENYVKRKATNKLPQYQAKNENDINELQKEKQYLDKEIERQESGRVFNVRDNIGNKQNYLMSMKNFMSVEERQEYAKLKERRALIERRINELKRNI